MVRSIMILLGVLASGAPAIANELVVQVTGIKSATGEIGCALHADAAGFLSSGGGLQGRWVKADPKGVTCRFSGLPAGTYAVAVLHDLNGNRKTDTNLVGIPTEEWGVSNNVRPAMRAPTFDEARVVLSAGKPLTVGVRLSR
jgi:uncharacterized protein (DUF2141 family)